MKNKIEIAGMTLTLELGPIEKDHDAGSQWRNGIVILPDGRRVSCGGGWIESEETADRENERLGIAGGLRQGASYPNEVQAGDFAPYAYGEDETGWQEVIMPLTLATKQHFHAVSHWSEMEDADDMARITYAIIQEGFQKLAELAPIQELHVTKTNGKSGATYSIAILERDTEKTWLVSVDKKATFGRHAEARYKEVNRRRNKRFTTPAMNPSDLPREVLTAILEAATDEHRCLIENDKVPSSGPKPKAPGMHQPGWAAYVEHMESTEKNPS